MYRKTSPLTSIEIDKTNATNQQYMILIFLEIILKADAVLVGDKEP